MTSSLYRVAKLVLAVVLLSGLSAVAMAGEEASMAKGVEGSAKADKMESCVKPTDWMRRNHMDLIQHSRDKTVHEGIRIQKDSLSGCVDCHARYDEKQQAVPVNASGEFCSGCHSYVGESLSCFQCHSTVPNANAQR